MFGRFLLFRRTGGRVSLAAGNRLVPRLAPPKASEHIAAMRQALSLWASRRCEYGRPAQAADGSFFVAPVVPAVNRPRGDRSAFGPGPDNPPSLATAPEKSSCRLARKLSGVVKRVSQDHVEASPSTTASVILSVMAPRKPRGEPFLALAGWLHPAFSGRP